MGGPRQTPTAPDGTPLPTVSSPSEPRESPVRASGVDYVSLVGVVILGLMGSVALWVGNEVVALAIGTGIVGFMARLSSEGK